MVFHDHIGKRFNLKVLTFKGIIYKFLFYQEAKNHFFEGTIPGVSVNEWMTGCLHKAYELTSYFMHYNVQKLSKTWFMHLSCHSFNICCMSNIVLGAGNTTQNSLKSQSANHFQNIFKHLQWVIDFFFLM